MSPKNDALRTRRRDAQLLVSARDIFNLVLAGELADPALIALELVDITYNSGYTGLNVVIQNRAPEIDQEQISLKLPALTDLLRAALAKRLHRKRVPAVKITLLPTRTMT